MSESDQITELRSRVDGLESDLRTLAAATKAFVEGIADLLARSPEPARAASRSRAGVFSSHLIGASEPIPYDDGG